MVEASSDRSRNLPEGSYFICDMVKDTIERTAIISPLIFLFVCESKVCGNSLCALCGELT